MPEATYPDVMPLLPYLVESDGERELSDTFFFSPPSLSLSLRRVRKRELRLQMRPICQDGERASELAAPEKKKKERESRAEQSRYMDSLSGFARVRHVTYDKDYVFDSSVRPGNRRRGTISFVLMNPGQDWSVVGSSFPRN